MDKNTCKQKTYKEIFEINEKCTNKQNENEKISLDTIFEGNGKYPYNYKEFEILLDEYNEPFLMLILPEDFIPLNASN